MNHKFANVLRARMPIGTGLACLLILAGHPARAEAPRLKAAISAYENFEYEEAIRLLNVLVASETLDTVTRARAWLYRGLVHFTIGDRTQAAEDFSTALKFQSSVRPPPDISPKILQAFESVRKATVGLDDEREPSSATDTVDKPPPSDIRPLQAAATALAPRRRMWTWICAGTGAAVLLGGGISGLLASQARQDFDEATWAMDAAELRDAVEARSLAANVLFGVGGAVLVTALILFFVEDREQSETARGSEALPGWTATIRF